MEDDYLNKIEYIYIINNIIWVFFQSECVK